MSVAKLREAIDVFDRHDHDVGQVDSAGGGATCSTSRVGVVENGIVNEGRLAIADVPSCTRGSDHGRRRASSPQDRPVRCGSRNLVIALLSKPAGDRRRITLRLHHTGDVGYTNEEGTLSLWNRRKHDISGGFTLFAEVEQVLASHPLSRSAR